MVPDGKSQNSIDTETINQKETPSWTLQQALTSKSFWILATVQTLGLCGLGPVLFHEIAYIQDKGFSVEVATIVAASLAASAMVSKLPFGYLADKMDRGYELEDAMHDSLEELDGVFTYVVATSDRLGMAKDYMAAKPMVLYESEDFVALASEEVAIRSIFPHEIDTFDPYEGEVRVWQS